MRNALLLASIITTFGVSPPVLAQAPQNRSFDNLPMMEKPRSVEPAIQNKGSLSKKTAPAVLVEFEGGLAAVNMARVIELAHEHYALNLENYTLRPNETLCGILVARGFPPPCAPLAAAVAKINEKENLRLGQLKEGEQILLPSSEYFTRYRAAQTYSRKLDRESFTADRIEKNWKDLNSERRLSQTETEVSFDGFRMYLPTIDDDDSRQLAQQVLRLNSSHVTVDVLREKPGPNDGGRIKSTVYAIQPDKVCDEIKTQSKTYDYRELIDFDQDALPLLSKPIIRTPVHIIDVPLLAAPSLFEAIGDTEPATLNCKWASSFRSVYHATHLAGIVAGHEKFGFRGLSTAKVYPFHWATPRGEDTNQVDAADIDRNSKLRDLFEEATNSPKRVFLAATDFEAYNLGPLPIGGHLENAEQRFARPLERGIKSRRPLLVVSAGQQTTPEALTPITNMFPQNLGDLPSVIVVTACADCGRTNPKLWDQANFGSVGTGDRNFVHVAAPGGKGIPGWVSPDQIAVGQGTSQAAAYVAGVIAAMVSRYPNVYNDASIVKSRLQVTSFPLGLGMNGLPHPDAAKVNAGIVDPVLAQLDPTKTWLKRNGIWKQARIKVIERDKDLPYANLTTGAVYPLKLKHVRRIVRSVNGNYFSIYIDRSLKDPDAEVDEVQRFGTLKLNDNKLLQLCDAPNQWIRPKDIDDLIVSVYGMTADDCLS